MNRANYIVVGICFLIVWSIWSTAPRTQQLSKCEHVCLKWAALVQRLGEEFDSSTCSIIIDSCRAGEVLSSAAVGLPQDRVPEDIAVNLVGAGDSFVDVGTNVGHLALQILQEVKGSRGFLFEPSSSVCQELLNKLIGASVQDRAVIFCSPVARRTNTEVAFEVQQASTSSFVGGAGSGSNILHAVALDDVLPNRHFALFKTDTQGLEEEVLRSASNIVKQSAIVLVESSFSLLRRSGSSVARVVSMLTSDFSCATMAWHGRVSEEPPKFSKLPAPIFSHVSGQKLEHLLERASGNGYSGWTDLLCLRLTDQK